MSSPATVEGGERLRLFLALPLPLDAAHAVASWQRVALDGGGRLVPPEHLHITLAFLGARPPCEVPALVDVLRAEAAQAVVPVLTPTRYRETRSVGMLVLDDEGGHAAALAGRLHERLESLGVYERERRPWLAHLTVLRFRSQPRLRPRLASLGSVSPSDAALYTSVLRPSGAQYEIVESVALGG